MYEVSLSHSVDNYFKSRGTNDNLKKVYKGAREDKNQKVQVIFLYCYSTTLHYFLIQAIKAHINFSSFQFSRHRIFLNK